MALSFKDVNGNNIPFDNKNELKLVDEAETIVTALVSLGFKKDYILDQLRRKFVKRIA